jgi:DNA invertase Pin-like site-specific DNA recombinase
MKPPVYASRRARKNDQPLLGRTFGYIRVSTGSQSEDGQSLDVQRRQLEGWAQMTGRTIDRIFVEPGVSGTLAFIRRPVGTQLWAELRKSDTVVGVKMDRMFRNTRDCLNTLHEMRARGIGFRLLDLGGGMDELTTNGQSTFFLHVMAAVAQFESERIGERIRATKQAQRERGEYSGGPPMFGYAITPDRQIVADPEQQQVIRRIRRLKHAGHSPRVIAAKLKVAGTPLSHVTIRKILAGRTMPA